MFVALLRSTAHRTLRAGPLLGAAAGIESVQPSLMHRSKIDQALVTAGSVTSAYLVGRTTEAVIRGTSRATGLNPLAVGGAVATAGLAISHRAAAAPATGPGRAWVRTGGALVSTAAFAATAGAAARRTIDDAPGRWQTVVASVANVALLGTMGALAVRERMERYQGPASPPMNPSAITQGLAIGAGTAAAAVVGTALDLRLAEAMARTGARRLPGPLVMWRPVAYGALIGASAYLGKAGLQAVLGKIEAGNSRVEKEYALAPRTANASGGPGSVVSYDDLGLQGRRFVSELSTPDRIGEVMGEDGVEEPIRVYVGVDSADTAEERIALAIEELRRTGAFDKSMVMVGSPAGTGYFNYIPVEAAEYMTRGDMASVAVQFGKLPSMLSMDKIGMAADQHAALVAAISNELESRPAEQRPRVALYGESLGAQASQDGFVDEGTSGMTRLGVDRALWVGTPRATRWKQQLFVGARDDVDPEILEQFHTSEQLAAATPEEQERLRFFFLDHYEDPVTRFEPEILVDQPSWLGNPAERLPGIPVAQRWVPLVTFWQTAIDTKNAATVIPGEFKAHGHDYRADLASFVRAAYGLEGVDDAQMERIEERLRRSEVERADRIAEG